MSILSKTPAAPAGRKRRSTSRKIAGCSECTQCPAPLTVSSTVLGKSLRMVGDCSAVT